MQCHKLNDLHGGMAEAAAAARIDVIESFVVLALSATRVEPGIQRQRKRLVRGGRDADDFESPLCPGLIRMNVTDQNLVDLGLGEPPPSRSHLEPDAVGGEASTVCVNTPLR